MKAIAAGFLLGVLGLGLVRFSFAPHDHAVHYHANFAVFVNGERLDLSADRYMEDVSACVGTGEIQPRQRVHLHNNDHDVVHVHHDGVAWGHFFENLGFGLGRDFLITDRGERLFDGEGGTLKFIVNGFTVPSLHDRPVRRSDRVLVSFGPESLEAVLAEQFPVVASNAPEFDALNDPAGCGGAAPASLGERLRSAFWW